MFYCNSCAESKNWPLTPCIIGGSCQVCGHNANTLNHVPDHMLPTERVVPNPPTAQRQCFDDNETIVVLPEDDYGKHPVMLLAGEFEEMYERGEARIEDGHAYACIESEPEEVDVPCSGDHFIRDDAYESENLIDEIRTLGALTQYANRGKRMTKCGRHINHRRNTPLDMTELQEGNYGE